MLLLNRVLQADWEQHCEHNFMWDWNMFIWSNEHVQKRQTSQSSANERSLFSESCVVVIARIFDWKISPVSSFGVIGIGSDGDEELSFVISFFFFTLRLLKIDTMLYSWKQRLELRSRILKEL